jgi:hypothetical protein
MDRCRLIFVPTSVVTQVINKEKTQHRFPILVEDTWITDHEPDEAAMQNAINTETDLVKRGYLIVEDCLIFADTGQVTEKYTIVAEAWVEYMDDVTVGDASAEGFGSIQDFKDDWDTRYTGVYASSQNPPMAVVDFTESSSSSSS